MSASWLLIVSIILLILAYRFYGKFLVRKFRIDPVKQTPAHAQRDGVDYVPAKSFVLLGHHFASIAGAGPIVGPVLAATFGWGPVWLWIITGVIFMGGVHDFSSMIASVRHQGKSVGQLIEEYIGKSGKLLFLMFTWFMLILVVAVFARAVATIFVKTPASASSSGLFMILAVAFGLATFKFRMPFHFATGIGVYYLMACVVLGGVIHIHLSFNIWIIILFLYVFIAAVTPVWILLQPRDYLNSFLLYFLMIGGFLGILFTQPKIQFPFFTQFHTDLGYMFPILFVTVACGAISGFHSLVASGTTSKQLNKETDARVIGYGGMLIEAVLAIIALITAIVLTNDEYLGLISRSGGGPIGVFSEGLGGFMSHLGIPLDTGITFAALAISAFALTTLDTATRLGRFAFQEIFATIPAPKIISQNRYVGTFVTIVSAAILTFSGSSNALWPLFGSANQMLAAMALLAVTVWLDHLKEKSTFVKIPMFFMLFVTMTALGSLIVKNLLIKNYLLFGVGLCLFGVGLVLTVQSVFRKSFWK
ncbi:carbon starvation protein A [bacterium]|nr:carbon starvation protein A [bacterium]